MCASTRTGLARNQLSVNSYSTDFGGFVYVGQPPYSIPVESDLARIFEVASAAGAVWLKFDIDASVIDGLPIFDELDLEKH